MLSTLMKDGILCNVQRSLTVAVELYGHGMTNPKAGKNTLDPLQFTCGTSHRTILSFSRRACYCMLFFGFPRDGGVTQENNQSGKRPTSKRTSSPVRVTPSIQLQITIAVQEDSLSGISFEVSNYTQSSIPIRGCCMNCEST